MSSLKYSTVLIKVSGEMLAGDRGIGIDTAVLERFAAEIHEVQELGVRTAVVLGGGNIFRGVSGASRGMDRSQADTMGMLATVMNGLALQDALERRGCHTRVMTAVKMDSVAEPYIRRRAVRHLEKGRVVVLVAGTGNPYFSTDTTAALRGAEIGADIIFKATKVDGVYDADPVKHPEARRYEHITYMEVLQQGLKVMDATAISLCMDNDIPIVVFDASEAGRIARAVKGEPIGTVVSNHPVA